MINQTQEIFMDSSELNIEISSIIRSRNLTALYQPIININKAVVFGHEALIRGPIETRLHSPLALFEAAHLVGMTPDMEFLSREIALSGYANAKNKNKLFVNISPHCLQLTDSTFQFNMPVPFIYDTVGRWYSSGNNIDEMNSLIFNRNKKIITQFTQIYFDK